MINKTEHDNRPDVKALRESMHFLDIEGRVSTLYLMGLEDAYIKVVNDYVRCKSKLDLLKDVVNKND